MARRMFGVVAGLLLIGCTLGTRPVGSQAPLGSAAPTDALASPAAPPSPRATPRIIAGSAMAPCILGNLLAQCGTLVVPENPGVAGGRTLSLRVAVIPALAASPAPDPLFVLAGGPGGAATESMAWTATSFHGTHATRDVVLVDQRGTGGSNQLWLANPPDLTGMSTAAARKAIKAWVPGAFAALDADASTYTTSVAMDDLDAVRSALGYDQINLFGASYGATAAQYYIRQHPERVRSAVLDGATLVDVPVMELIAASSQRALDLLFTRCDSDAACSHAYPTLRAEWKAVLAQLDQAPVDTGIAQPLGEGTIRLDRTGFAGAIHQALIQSDISARVPRLIHAAAAGRWDELGHLIAAMSQPPETGILMMSGVIRCSEAWARFDPDETRELSAGSYYLEAEVQMATGQLLGCPFAPKGIVPADDGVAAQGAMPVLFVVGEADPQDPPDNIADAPGDFPNSLTVVARGQGHTVGHLGCLPEVIDAFIAAGSAADLDTSCVAAMQPPAFELP